MENLYNIGIECEEKAYASLADATYAADFMPTAISRNENNHYLIFYSNIKWDVRHPSIRTLENALAELDSHSDEHLQQCEEEYGYAFAKLGEEYTDIELRSNTHRVEYPLKREINKDGFDEEITYEPQEEKEIG